MGVHELFLESQFSSWHAMGAALEELRKVAILRSSLTEPSEFHPIIISTHTSPEATTTSDYVTTILMEEYRQMTQ